MPSSNIDDLTKRVDNLLNSIKPKDELISSYERSEIVKKSSVIKISNK
jgi:hypothetical protein